MERPNKITGANAGAQPSVTVRLTLAEDEAMKIAAFAQAEAEGWARRGRK